MPTGATITSVFTSCPRKRESRTPRLRDSCLRLLHTMARENIPVLCGGIIAFEVFMTAWEEQQAGYALESHPASDWIEEGLFWARKYYNRMNNSKAYIVTMCK